MKEEKVKIEDAKVIVKIKTNNKKQKGRILRIKIDGGSLD